MKIVKIRDDVWKFKGQGSVYLIRQGDKWVLIDAGDESDKGDLSREISKVVSLDKVDAVLLTHSHLDHLAGITLFPNAEIYASKEEIEDYRKDAEGFHFFVDEEVDKIFRERVRELPDEIFGLKVLRVPGHTRGGVAFLDEKRKLLFSGDTIFGGNIEGRTDLPNSVPEKMGESVRGLRKLVIDEGLGICPGHGYWEDSQN